MPLRIVDGAFEVHSRDEKKEQKLIVPNETTGKAMRQSRQTERSLWHLVLQGAACRPRFACVQCVAALRPTEVPMFHEMLLRFMDIARQKCAWAVQGGKVLLCTGQSTVQTLRCN